MGVDHNLMVGANPFENRVYFANLLGVCTSQHPGLHEQNNCRQP